MPDPLANLDVFYGDLTANRALIYARLPRPADDSGLTLSGTVRGPRCLHAQTLPASFSLVDAGPGPTLLARATVSEPCNWSPDLPAIYDVVVHLMQGHNAIATCRREIGFRSFGIRNRHLVLEGKPWVLRGVTTASTTTTMPRQWHDASAAYVTPANDADALAEASQWGAFTVALVNDSGERVSDRLRELSRHPAVAIVHIAGSLPAGFDKRQVAPNVLLAQAWTAEREGEVEHWADLLCVSISDSRDIPEFVLSASIPVVVERWLNAPLEIAEGRAACDALQRDLASIGQFAGYIV